MNSTGIRPSRFRRWTSPKTPAFRYRQSQGYGMAQDSVYRLTLRLEEPRDIFAGGLWVHTFNSLLPASVYGAEHPEYYSFINGERRPGRSQPMVPDERRAFRAGGCEGRFDLPGQPRHEHHLHKPE